MADSLTISVPAACRRYHVSRKDLEALVRQGLIPTIRLPRRVLILKAMADDYFIHQPAHDNQKAEEQLCFELRCRRA